MKREEKRRKEWMRQKEYAEKSTSAGSTAKPATNDEMEENNHAIEFPQSMLFQSSHRASNRPSNPVWQPIVQSQGPISQPILLRYHLIFTRVSIELTNTLTQCHACICQKI